MDPGLFEAAGPGGDASFLPRPITMEEAVGRQLDRIAHLRSRGEPWSEAVFMLRDLVVGLEDEEFWDGLPDKERASLASLAGPQAVALRRAWAREGWRGMRMRAYRRGGAVIYRPTAENLSKALRIIMRVLARRGVAWRTRRRSGLGPRGVPEAAAADTAARGLNGGPVE